MKYYIAYGSNLNKRQMQYRCPTAKALGTADLQDFELIFCLNATIEPAPGKSVPVGIWEIDETAEKQLDRYEGYPRYYRKEAVKVDLCGESVEALVYIMNREDKEACLPQKAYLDTITRGYYDFGLPLTELVTALNHTATLSGKDKVLFLITPPKRS